VIALDATACPLVLPIAIYVGATSGRRRAFSSTRSCPWCPPLGIKYQLGVDGMSLLMVLCTAIIIFAGSFASWTVKERSQEFYALLLLLVTGVYGVFVSLDLFVSSSSTRSPCCPMYLLIGIWGSSGEVRPQGIFGWAMRRTGVGTKEYAAMKLTLYLLFGSAFILVGILALYVAAGLVLVLVPRVQLDVRSRGCSRWVFLAFYVGFGILAGIWPLHTWSPDGHASAPTACPMLHAACS
jgi:NADH-quinone oxidoreductase subunit M